MKSVGFSDSQGSPITSVSNMNYNLQSIMNSPQEIRDGNSNASNVPSPGNYTNIPSNILQGEMYPVF